MPQSGKFLIRSAPALLAAFWLSSCAQKPDAPAGPEAMAAPTGQTSIFSSPKSRAVRSVSLSGPAEKDVTPAVAAAPQPSPTEQIASLVRNGSLIDSGRGVMVFSRVKQKPRSQAGLYEDAILLAGLRRQLMAAGGLPPAIAASATIHASEAFLKLDTDYPAEISAKAIDAALKAPGISAVNAKLVSAIRL